MTSHHYPASPCYTPDTPSAPSVPTPYTIPTSVEAAKGTVKWSDPLPQKTLDHLEKYFPRGEYYDEHKSKPK